MANRPDGDVWNITDNDKDSQHYGRNFKFDFSYISSEEIKDVVKDYVWQNYRVENKSLSTLYREVNAWFFQFIRFADTRNITSLKGLTNTDVDHFISYLHTTISERTKKPFETSMQRNCLKALKSVVYWCQLHRPNDVPATEIFTGNEYTGVNRKLKIDFIPDDVVAQITKSISLGSVLAASKALRAAIAPIVAAVSSGAAILRSLIPVRSKIHSFDVSTMRSKSALVRICSGK